MEAILNQTVSKPRISDSRIDVKATLPIFKQQNERSNQFDTIANSDLERRSFAWNVIRFRVERGLFLRVLPQGIQLVLSINSYGVIAVFASVLSLDSIKRKYHKIPQLSFSTRTFHLLIISYLRLSLILSSSKKEPLTIT